ncbi:hypothetical protein BDY21DRAFT_139706 [Lineolata rhizophorae]|uniref:Uncharacterized protein n=1 Tax=Lineolata rhizophorae TaxID=578093 RepID=A0A6A6PBG8_9PEZI|nr:hypothetical protein BDY21DRAFT_139706 [Lineolata rhizophorae]
MQKGLGGYIRTLAIALCAGVFQPLHFFTLPQTFSFAAAYIRRRPNRKLTGNCSAPRASGSTALGTQLLKPYESTPHS